jgi:hypothetical protein
LNGADNFPLPICDRKSQISAAHCLPEAIVPAEGLAALVAPCDFELAERMDRTLILHDNLIDWRLSI